MNKLESHRGAAIFSTCPKCKKRNYQRYVTHIYGEGIADNVGECALPKGCGYSYTPSEHEKAVSFIPDRYLLQSLNNCKDNNLFNYLVNQFGEDKATTAMKLYSIGTSVNHPGASVFWVIDIDGKVREGKIKLFDSYTGKETKDIGTVSRIIKMKHFTHKSYLYGENLINKFPKKPVALVESEREAIVSSCKHPDYLWLSISSPGLGLLKTEETTLGKRDFIYDPKTWGV